jgi:hypothetical protein
MSVERFSVFELNHLEKFLLNFESTLILVKRTMGLFWAALRRERGNWDWGVQSS